MEPGADFTFNKTKFEKKSIFLCRDSAKVNHYKVETPDFNYCGYILIYNYDLI